MPDKNHVIEKVLRQPVVCSTPWRWSWFERRFRDSCVGHDVGYVVRSGDRNDRSLLRYIWDEIVQRRRTDKAFLNEMLMQSDNLLEKTVAYVSYGVVRLFGWSFWWWNEKENTVSEEVEKKPNLFQRLVSPIVNTFWGNEPVKRKQGTNSLLTIIALYFLIQNGGIDINTDQILQYIGCSFFVDCQAMGIELPKILENIG